MSESGLKGASLQKLLRLNSYTAEKQTCKPDQQGSHGSQPSQTNQTRQRQTDHPDRQTYKTSQANHQTSQA